MPNLLSTKDTTSQIDHIITSANKYLVIACPYYKLTPRLLQLLHEAIGKVERTIVIYRELKPEVKSQLEKIPKLELYFVKDFHAKCYFNEQSMVISSMNLNEYAEVHNWEMSILIDKNEDQILYRSALQEINRALKSIKQSGLDIIQDTVLHPC